jgi:hypothetical protein
MSATSNPRRPRPNQCPHRRSSRGGHVGDTGISPTRRTANSIRRPAPTSESRCPPTLNGRQPTPDPNLRPLSSSSATRTSVRPPDVRLAHRSLLPIPRRIAAASDAPSVSPGSKDSRDRLRCTDRCRRLSPHPHLRCGRRRRGHPRHPPPPPRRPRVNRRPSPRPFQRPRSRQSRCRNEVGGAQSTN